jgi:predicted transcriptional regulator
MALTHSGDTDDDQTEAFRVLNDELRHNLTIGIMTAGAAGADGLRRYDPASRRIATRGILRFN